MNARNLSRFFFLLSGLSLFVVFQGCSSATGDDDDTTEATPDDTPAEVADVTVSSDYTFSRLMFDDSENGSGLDTLTNDNVLMFETLYQDLTAMLEEAMAAMEIPETCDVGVLICQDLALEVADVVLSTLSIEGANDQLSLLFEQDLVALSTYLEGTYGGEISMDWEQSGFGDGQLVTMIGELDENGYGEVILPELSSTLQIWLIDPLTLELISIEVPIDLTEIESTFQLDENGDIQDIDLAALLSGEDLMAIEEELVAVLNDLLDVYGIELSFPTDGNKVSSKQTPSGGQLLENYGCILLAPPALM